MSKIYAKWYLDFQPSENLCMHCDLHLEAPVNAGDPSSGLLNNGSFAAMTSYYFLILKRWPTQKDFDGSWVFMLRWFMAKCILKQIYTELYEYSEKLEERYYGTHWMLEGESSSQSLILTGSIACPAAYINHSKKMANVTLCTNYKWSGITDYEAEPFFGAAFARTARGINPGEELYTN